jgi:hypothetical protein
MPPTIPSQKLAVKLVATSTSATNHLTHHNQHLSINHHTMVALKNAMYSATEAEFAGLFYNACDGTSLQTTLIEMGHLQPRTPIQTDNSTSTGIINGTVSQKHFLVHWRKVSENLGDYFTSKHQSTAHHRQVRPTYLHVAKLEANATRQAPTSAICLVQGCIQLLSSGLPFSPTKPTSSATQLTAEPPQHRY